MARAATWRGETPVRLGKALPNPRRMERQRELRCAHGETEAWRKACLANEWQKQDWNPALSGPSLGLLPPRQTASQRDAGEDTAAVQWRTWVGETSLGWVALVPEA